MPKTGMYVLQGIDPAAIAAAPFDVKVIDIYNDDGQVFTPAEVKEMGGGPGQALLLGYFSIGEAETYRDYFSTIPEAAIGPENPQWKGNFEVAYWTPEWKAVAEAYIDNMIKAGYDGVYFDVVDEFQLSWAQQNAPNGDAAGAMQKLVVDLSAYAKAQVTTFKVWVNGAEELLTDQKYVDSIDGMFKENLFYNDNGSSEQAAEDTQASLDLLKIAQNAGKDVVAIEYVTGAQKVDDVHAKSDAAGIASYVAKLDLDGVDTEGVLPGQVMHDDGLGGGTVTPPVVAPVTPPPPLSPVDNQNGEIFMGTDRSDNLEGGAGDDVLTGLGGRDKLTGGGGADTFAFKDFGRRTADTITDFQHGTDHIALDHSVFTHVGPVGELSLSAFVRGTDAHDATDRMIYDSKSGNLSYDPDGNGLTAAKVVGHLDPELTVDHHDIHII